METGKEPNVLKEIAENSKNLSALDDNDLQQIAGGYEEGYFLSYYQCPFCHREHHFKLTLSVISRNFHGTAIDECSKIRNIYVEDTYYTGDEAYPIAGTLRVISSDNTIVVPFKSAY